MYILTFYNVLQIKKIDVCVTIYQNDVMFNVAIMLNDWESVILLNYNYEIPIQTMENMKQCSHKWKWLTFYLGFWLIECAL